MQELTFNIDDRREIKPPTSVENFHLTFGNQPGADLPGDNWVQGRQNADSLRQVFVNIRQGSNDMPYNVTGFILQFAGRTAVHSDGKSYRIIDNSSVVVDGANGRMRFTFPAAAFAVAGTYKQAYFRLIREADYKCVATLEFDLSVIQDFVFNDIMPSDWVDPFNDVRKLVQASFSDFQAQSQSDLADTKKQLQTMFDQASQRVSDTVEQMTSLGATVKEGLQTAQTALEALQLKIQQDELFTQAEAAQFEQTIRDHLQKMVDEANATMTNTVVSDYSAMAASDQQNFYAEAMPTYYRDSFDHATNDVPHGDHIVNIAYITDNHHQEDANPWSPKSYSGKSLEHYQWFAQATLRTKPEVAIANGDNINGDSYMPSDIWTTMHVWSMLSTVYLKTALFMLPGNHDTGVGQTPKLVPADAMDEGNLKDIYHTRQPLYGEVRNGDSLYFYKDLTDKKVRVIGLNSSDMPWTTDDQGNYVHNRLEEAAFSATQLQWLVTKALALPDNSWQVVFFFHHPLSTGVFYNAQAFIDIIKAFKAGASTSINRNDVADMPITGLTADFKAQGPGTVIGVFNGHFHADEQDLTTLNGTPIVITDASLSNSIGPQLARRNTVNEDCWETISINTHLRTIHCYRFGRGADREFKY